MVLPDASDDGPTAAPGEWFCTGPIEYDTAAMQRDIANLKAAIEGSTSSTRSCPSSRRRARTGSRTSTTRATRSSSSPRRRAAPSTARSSTPGFCSRSTTRCSCTSTTRSCRWAGRSRTTGAGRRSGSRPRTTRSRESREERVRYHVCCGSWHGPHASTRRCPRSSISSCKVPRATTRSSRPTRATSTSGGSGRTSKLPDGKVLIPGVVTHHTNVVEHPELVAQRLVRLAKIVGRENVIGGTDCGFAQGAFIRRVHPTIQWAKLEGSSRGRRARHRRALAGCRSTSDNAARQVEGRRRNGVEQRADTHHARGRASASAGGDRGTAWRGRRRGADGGGRRRRATAGRRRDRHRQTTGSSASRSGSGT